MSSFLELYKEDENVNLKLKQICIENFKGIKDLVVNFRDKTIISGQNATGKTTIIDGFMWLMFGKDSQGRADFSIRPTEQSGAVIDNVVIKVTAVLDVNGKEVVITKTQEQNWVKKRGSEVSQLQGNVNRYEINEIPKTEKDYRAFINDLLSEELFKLITSPQAFTALKWKDQRTILMKLVSEVTDRDVIVMDEKFSSLADMLQDVSVDDLAAKAKKALKELNRKQEELPARIDEANKGLVQVDFSEYEVQKRDLEEQIRILENQEGDASEAGKAMEQIQSGIMQRQSKQVELRRRANEELTAQKRAIQKRIDEAEAKFADAFRNQKNAERDIQYNKDMLDSNRALREALLKKHKETKTMRMDPEACHCPMCGQSLPDEQREVKIAEFSRNKQKSLEDIINNGKKAAANITDLEGAIRNLEEQIDACKAEKIKQNSLKAAAIKELDDLPQEVDISGNREYRALSEEIRKLEERVREMGTGTDYLKQIRQKKAGLVAELDRVKVILSGKDNNQRIQERIAELQQEQRVISQKIANQEKGLFLLEEFTKAKMNLLSSRINARFKLVNFRLFESQINGGYKETCECMVGGVPFSSLNAGHKVVAGLDIISALQDIYDVTAPIFIDNAESINDFNIPDMQGQLILLKVSDDNELKVEV